LLRVGAEAQALRRTAEMQFFRNRDYVTQQAKLDEVLSDRRRIHLYFDGLFPVGLQLQS
jgi:hypothetical protein